MTRAELQRAERNLRVVESAHPHDHERRAAALQEAIAAARNSPATVDAYFDLAGLLDELSTAYETLGRPDEALDAMQQAIEAGYAGTPDPRCRLAEIQLRAGRSDEAHRVFADVKRDTPDDVWLYNNAGLEYHHAGDHARALEWFDPGLELAMATHDPERLVDQLADLRQGSLEALGREPDDLQRRARAFLADPPPRRRFPGHPPDPTAGPLLAHPPHRPAYGSPPTALDHAAPPPVGRTRPASGSRLVSGRGVARRLGHVADPGRQSRHGRPPDVLPQPRPAPAAAPRRRPGATAWVAAQRGADPARGLPDLV